MYDADGYRIARSTLLADALRPGVTLSLAPVASPGLGGAEGGSGRVAVILPTLEERTLPFKTELSTMRADFDKMQELKNMCDQAAEAVRQRWLAVYVCVRVCVGKRDT
jgi:hypothetical protein